MSNNGFTLLEMIVAAFILIIVVVAAATMYTTATSAQRRAYGKQNALDSTRYTLEIMGRAIRQSTIQAIATNTITILHPDSNKCGTLPLPCSVRYRLSSGRIQESIGTASFVNITSDDVVVESLRFTGNITGTGVHPKITISMIVRSITTKPTEQSRVRVQTTIASRVPE